MLLELEDLHVGISTRQGRVDAVRGVTLSVDRDEAHCLVGESGCGKTMTAMAVMGLLPPGSHLRARRLSFDGIDLLSGGEAAMRKLRGKRIAMIFQDPMTALNPTFTIGVQLQDVLLQHEKVTRQAARDRAAYLLQRVGIRDALARLRQYPHELSGGLRQRVMIAMALMCQPELLVADEPTTALDMTVQAEVLSLLSELRREYRLGLLLVSHDLAVVGRMADRVSVMYGGEVVETGRAPDVLERPSHPYTRGLLQCVPQPGRMPHQARLYTIPGTVGSFPDGLAQCAFLERCEQAQAACAEGAIALVDLGRSHCSRCKFAGEAAPQVKVPEAAI